MMVTDRVRKHRLAWRWVVAFLLAAGLAASGYIARQRLKIVFGLATELEGYKFDRRATTIDGIAKTAPLSDLLAHGKVADFNRARAKAPFAGHCLEMTVVAVGVNLSGVDLSNCILIDSRFIGCNMTRASFKNSFVALAAFGSASPMDDTAPPPAKSPTLLNKADFTGAVCRLTVPGHEARWVDLRFADTTGAIGLPDNLGSDTQTVMRVAAATQPADAIKAFKAAPVKRKDVLAAGRHCDNPFASVSGEGAEAWRRIGIDVAALGALSAVRVRYVGGERLDFYNEDPQTVLVIGTDFNTYGDIYSAGPVVVLESTETHGNIVGSSVVWFCDQTIPRGLTIGRPIVVCASAELSGLTTLSDVYVGSFRPGEVSFEPVISKPDPSFIPLPPIAPDDKLSDAFTRYGAGTPKNAAFLRKVLADLPIKRIARALGQGTQGDRSAAWTVPATAQAELGPKLWARIVADHPDIRGMKAVAVEGEHFGVDSDDLILTDAKTILFLRSHFQTHGSVFSAGPIVALGDNDAFCVASKAWIEQPGELRSPMKMTPLRIETPPPRPTTPIEDHVMVNH